MKKLNLVGLTLSEIHDLIRPEGYNLSHASAIANSIYKKRAADFSEISKIPRKLQLLLRETAEVAFYEPLTSETSSDGTVKYLFRNHEEKLFETVCMPDRKHDTVCVSTQSGCRMGCPFCVTARYGYHGDLDAGDIVGQILSIPHAARLTHVVFMGMGEPLDNTENVVKACEIITSEWGMSLSPSDITVSTVGITPSVIPFLEKTECNLAISLFSPFPEERIKIVPSENKYPVAEIIDILKKYPVRKKRRISAACVMISGINDTERHLNGLKEMLKGTGIRVNLLPYHGSQADNYVSSSYERMMYFKHNLVMSGISASIRKSRGADISAACGMLASGLVQQKEMK